MSKSQTFYYAGVVALITLAAYLYTSVAEAPHSSVAVVEQEDVNTTNETTLAGAATTSLVQDNSISQAENPTALAFTLADTSWRWLRTENASGTIVFEPRGRLPFILRFGASSEMVSQTDCNTVTGSYETVENSLIFSHLASTKMYCENSQEDDYIQQLSQVISYSLANNTLLLSQADTDGTMFFVRTDR